MVSSPMSVTVLERGPDAVFWVRR